MNESKHWSDHGAPPEFERLLRAARSEVPPPESVERALLAAGVTGAATLASSTAVACATGKTLLGVATQWLAIGAIGAGAIAATSALTERPAATLSPVTPSLSPAPAKDRGAAISTRIRPQPGAASSTGVSPAKPWNNSSALSGPLAVNAGASRNAAPVHPRERAIGAPSATTRIPDPDLTLVQEMALVDTARSQLHAGNADGALNSAREYKRRFRGGRFAPEILFLEMQAQLRLGEPRVAAEVARELLLRFPNGAQAPRARELLESDAGTSKSLIKPDAARD
jgi:hypothetical protein